MNTQIIEKSFKKDKETNSPGYEIPPNWKSKNFINGKDIKPENIEKDKNIGKDVIVSRNKKKMIIQI